MLFDLPYGVRVAVVLAVLAAVPAVDLVRHGARATRWRERVFWVGCGARREPALRCAGGSGHVADVAGSGFVIGKSLTDDATFARELVFFGLRVGSVAGLAIGGALLIANNPKADLPQLGYRALARYAVLPLVCALAAAPVVAAISGWDVQGLGASLHSLLPDAEVLRFLRVQRIHVGLYAGALLGTLVACAWVRRERRGRRAVR